jgi:anti-sigma regulatory factor (Ser/Thr protein kinase)
MYRPGTASGRRGGARRWRGSVHVAPGARMSNTTATIPQERTFVGSPQEVSNVRHFVRQLIDGCPVTDGVVLLASELATNAIRHTASGADGTFCILVQAADGQVRVEVHDMGSVTVPAVRRSGPPRESGVGLAVVEAIASRWGFHGSQFGRVVWFEIDWQRGITAC